MLKKETFVPMAFFKKEAYTGSMKGMRYRVAKGEEGFEVWVYPEPFSFDATPKEQKRTAQFPFTEEGRCQAVDWINQKYEEELSVWEKAARR